MVYFDNLRGDPEIDWLRRGIPEMLVTELGQSPSFDVLRTGTLASTLEELGAGDETLALPRGDLPAAVEALERAAESLPSRGIEFNGVEPMHLDVWCALAEAALKSGDGETARRWLEKVHAAGSERLTRPVPWLRGASLNPQAHDKREAHRG